ncbi:MAG TPA: glycosyltransferase [Candidatus Didemnitutus sp.]|nr:glycosyltransferase [Candidatus Didemnitutus sp.]
MDVALLAVADVTRDARTLNLSRALLDAGLTVEVVGMTAADSQQRALRRWWTFNKNVAALSLRPRLVVAMDLFALSAARSLSKTLNVPLLYDMREFYFALGPLAGKGFKQKILASHERRLLHDVDDVIVSGELDADIVQEHFALAKRPVVLLNTPPFKERTSSPLRSPLPLPISHSNNLPISHSITLAGYQGVIHHGRGLAPFMKAMTQMPSVHLVVVGDGPAQPELAKLSMDLGVAERVTWYGSVPYDELHALTCGFDVGLCLIEPVSMSYEYALPNKLFEYMMAGVPSLVTDLPALHDHIIRHPVGVLVERALSPNSIVNAMERVMFPETRAAMQRACEGIREMSYDRQARTAVALVREHLT